MQKSDNVDDDTLIRLDDTFSLLYFSIVLFTFRALYVKGILCYLVTTPFIDTLKLYVQIITM